jgi:hypothetical protein
MRQRGCATQSALGGQLRSGDPLHGRVRHSVTDPVLPVFRWHSGSILTRPAPPTKRTLNVATTFPARALRQDDRELFNVWLKEQAYSVSGYISDRRSDDPALYRKVVIAAQEGASPTHLVWSPTGLDIWIVQELPTGKLSSFASLGDALESIEPIGRHGEIEGI